MSRAKPVSAPFIGVDCKDVQVYTALPHLFAGIGVKHLTILHWPDLTVIVQRRKRGGEK